MSYNDKHNAANGEDDRDGESHNRSWNCGVEGPTDDLDVIALREQQKRNFLATLFLSQGVPMLLAGDELGRTQGGNNNAYCQDNTISWVDWQLERENEFLLDFTAQLARLRRRHPIFRRRKFFAGAAGRRSGGLDDIVWLRNTGEQMSDEDWASGFCPHRRRIPQRPRDSQSRSARPARHRRLVPALLQRPLGRRPLHPSPGGLRPELGGRRQHRGARSRSSRSNAASSRCDVVDVDARAVLVLRRVF